MLLPHNPQPTTPPSTACIGRGGGTDVENLLNGLLNELEDHLLEDTAEAGIAAAEHLVKNIETSGHPLLSCYNDIYNAIRGHETFKDLDEWRVAFEEKVHALVLTKSSRNTARSRSLYRGYDGLLSMEDVDNYNEPRKRGKDNANSGYR